jgi:putative exporter of polyketide antibiotics
MATQNSINTVVLKNELAYSPASAGTATLDLSKGNTHNITMPAGNITIAISNATVGQCFMVNITQDANGSRTVTWFTTIKWAGGTAPTLTTTASKRDCLGFRVTGSNTYDGFVVGQNI